MTIRGLNLGLYFAILFALAGAALGGYVVGHGEGLPGASTTWSGREPGTSLRAAGWLYAGLTKGGEHDRPSRRRGPSVEAGRKHRWFAPWGMRARALVEDGGAG